MNKTISWILNVAFVIGLIIAIEYRFSLWYILATSAIMIIIFWKPLVHFWKVGGNLYADKCIDIGKKIRGKK